MLSSYGIFEELDNKIFKLNALGETFVSDDPDSLYPIAIYLNKEDSYFRAFSEILYSIETGKSSFEKVFHTSFFEYLKQNKSSHENFNQYMVGKFTPIFRDVIKKYDFSLFNTIVDIGGGNGNFIFEILKKYKNAHGVIFDLQELRKTVLDNIAKESLTGRCEFIGDDFFITIPKNADLYIMKSIIHDWADNDAIKILNNCYNAMSKNSKLLIIEQIVYHNQSNDCVKLSDMMMLSLFGSKERSKEEFTELLSRAHFKISNILETDTEFSIIEVIK